MATIGQLQRASFRGVPFFVEQHEAAVGRRVQVHEYPLRDEPYAEDLGRKARTLTLDAYVLGADYAQQRNSLLAAIEKPGAGKLVHPYLGELQCTVTECKLRESTAEGGFARFALTLVEGGEKNFPEQQLSRVALIAGAGASLTQALQASVVQNMRVAGRPVFVAEAAAALASKALDGIAGAVGLVRGAADELAALNEQVVSARRDIELLLYTPGSAAQALMGSLQQLVRNVATAPSDALALARLFFTFGSPLALATGNTPSRRSQAANQVELVQLVRLVAVAEGARAAADVTFDSYQAAVAVRDDMTATMDDAMLSTASDDVYGALRALRAAVVRDFAARGANLARLVSYTPRATVPSLLLAQQLYADGTRAEELVQRNRTRHPLFVPGGAALEVLDDG